MKEVFNEVYEILVALGPKYFFRVPKHIMNEITKNKKENSILEININKPLEEQDISKEAIDIIMYLNYNYFSDNRIKNVLLNNQ